MSDWLSTSRLYATSGSHARGFRFLLVMPSSARLRTRWDGSWISSIVDLPSWPVLLGCFWQCDVFETVRAGHARHKRDLSPVCRPRNGRKMSSIRNPLNSMRFTKRFSPRCVGTVVISVHPRFGRAKADFIWRGPCPPFEQRLAWTKRCFHRWSNLSGWPARFLSINRAGVCEIWESLPGRPTQCTERIDEKKPSLKRALNFASQMLSHPQGIKKDGLDDQWIS